MHFRFLAVFGATLAFVFEVAATCNQDNCLRAFQDRSATASSFCATWSGVTTDLPTYASICSYLPSRISSACSCLATATSTSSTSRTSSSSTSSLSPSPTTCYAVSTFTSVTTVSIARGVSTVTDGLTQTSTATSYVILPPVTVTVNAAGVLQGLATCSCGPTPTPILNPSYENANEAANWTFAKSESNIIVEFASDINGTKATEGSFFLIASIPETTSTDESVQISQVINLCEGEGQYTFSVDAVLLSTAPSCYVFVWAYQGTGTYPPGPDVELWGSGAFAVTPAWTQITFEVPYINPGLGIAWTLLANIECLVDPGTSVTRGEVGLDNWKANFVSDCVATEVLVPPRAKQTSSGGSDDWNLPGGAPGAKSTSSGGSDDWNMPGNAPGITTSITAAADNWNVPGGPPGATSTSSGGSDDWNLPGNVPGMKSTSSAALDDWNLR